MCQGGDFLHGNGTGCTSIYNKGNRTSFDDEWDQGFISHAVRLQHALSVRRVLSVLRVGRRYLRA